MRPKKTAIPVNTFDDEQGSGMSIEKAFIKTLPPIEESEQSHRHDRHSFFLLESGTVAIEIDFKKYTIKPSSVIYMHPNQVHRMLAFENVTVSSWAITNEHLNPEYLTLLEEITPVKPLVLKKEAFSLMTEAVSLSIKFSERKQDTLYQALLKDSCNALVALVISHYLEQAKSTDTVSRFDVVSKAFRKLVEHHYTRLKRPSEYAQRLHISTPYLNECVKQATGYSVSHHLQQRLMLEAKRLLRHSNKTVKEIATELGYDDYPYFSRLFTKVTGMTALTFRNKTLR